MPRIEVDLNPISHITTDAIGEPGKRKFYLQGRHEDHVVTLGVEKIQIQTLAIGVEQFLSEIAVRFPDLPDASGDYIEEKMYIQPPIDPLFRVGELGLAYDSEVDKLILVAKEVLDDDIEKEEAGVVRFWCTRSQVLGMCRWGLEVASRGRPICAFCGEPIDPSGHLCPKKNGHKH